MAPDEERRTAVIIEDDADIRHLLEAVLSDAGFHTIATGNGLDGVQAVKAYDPIVTTLDMGMPGIDGLETARRIRQFSQTYLVIVSARSEEIDTLQALDAGADDYLTKPFAVEELLARLRALSRRQPGYEPTERLQVGDLVLDRTTQEVRRGDTPIELTAKEFALLEFLMRHPNQVLSRDRIIEQVWGYESDAPANAVDIYIHFLRRKIDHGFPRPLIHSVRGVGYKIQA